MWCPWSLWSLGTLGLEYLLRWALRSCGAPGPLGPSGPCVLYSFDAVDTITHGFVRPDLIPPLLALTTTPCSPLSHTIFPNLLICRSPSFFSNPSPSLTHHSSSTSYCVPGLYSSPTSYSTSLSHFPSPHPSRPLTLFPNLLFSTLYFAPYPLLIQFLTLPQLLTLPPASYPAQPLTQPQFLTMFLTLCPHPVCSRPYLASTPHQLLTSS